MFLEESTSRIMYLFYVLVYTIHFTLPTVICSVSSPEAYLTFRPRDPGYSLSSDDLVAKVKVTSATSWPPSASHRGVSLSALPTDVAAVAAHCALTWKVLRLILIESLRKVNAGNRLGVFSLKAKITLQYYSNSQLCKNCVWHRS